MTLLTTPLAAADAPELSIVVPVYYNEGSLPETVPALAAVAQKIAGNAFELIFVDDGSKDRSADVLDQFRGRAEMKIRVVKLTRNFGSMAAILAGLSVSRGRKVGIISADLQDPPELFEEMYAQLAGGSKCAFAVRKEREEGVIQRMTTGMYYALLRRYALPGYPSGGFDFCLLDRQVVSELVRMDEKNAHLMNLIFWLGFPTSWIPYTRRQRRHGRSRWTLAKKLKLFADSFVAFSFAPIRAVSIAGFALAALAAVYGGFQIWLRISEGTPVQGFTTIVTLIALTSGIQMMMLGVLGEYLWRTLDASRKRPQYVIERILESENE
jgi:polyisoprenyl-phosphate glycosyltransferase